MKFDCRRCGNCCTHLKRKLNSKITYPQQIPFYLYPEARDVSLLLFEWEKNTLQVEAERREMELKIIPGHISFDRDGRCIVFTWMMNYKICPFYDGKCSIYEKRPLVCQSYPLLETNFLKPGSTFNISSLCPSIVHVGEATIHTLHQIYGSTLEGALKKEKAKIWIDSLFNYMLENNILHKKIYARKKVLEKCKACIGVLDYLKEKNLLTEDVIKESIKKIEDIVFFKQG